MNEKVGKEPLVICYYSSDFYAPYTGISMYSLCVNNKALDFEIDVIDTGISEENKEKMKAVADVFGKELKFCSFKKLEAYIRDELKLPLCSGSYATYIKVFPEQIFPDLDRILFMDGDTIINGSIDELINLNIEPYVFAAAKVPLVNEKHCYTDDPISLRTQYALKFHGSGYYNIGVFYANLKRWKEVNFGEQIMAQRAKHLQKMSTVSDIPIDEMLVNLAVLEKLDENYVCEIPAIYNSVMHQIPHYRAWKATSYCGYIGKKAFDIAYYHPIIIHYCIFKPWFTDAFCPHRRPLNRYIAQSPWPDAFREKLYKTIPEKFFGKFVYSMPSEELMMIAIECGHLFLRTRARLIAFLSNLRNQISTKFKRSSRQRQHKERVLNRPHFVLAIERRFKCLTEGNIKEAFAWPKDYINKRKHLNKK